MVVLTLIVSMMFSGGGKSSKTEEHKTPEIGVNGSNLKQTEADVAERLKMLGMVQNKVAHTPTAKAPQHEHNQMTAQQEAALMNAPMSMSFQRGASDKKSSAPKVAQTNSGMVGHDGYSQFANSQATSVNITEATRVKNPDWTVIQGEFLHAVLNVAISSEIQGSVTATVTHPMYSYTGQNLLIPTGSRLVGQYAQTGSGNGMAASRVFIIWNRVITPDGVSVMINSQSTDTLGRNGQGADYVDTHFFKMFGVSILISIIGAGAANANNSASGMTSSQQYQSAVQSSLSSTANSILGQYTNIQPTLYVNQGTEINVFINKDLDMYSALHRAEG